MNVVRFFLGLCCHLALFCVYRFVLLFPIAFGIDEEDGEELSSY